MSLWFNREGQDEILLKYLPKGKVYKQAHIKGSNFNKIIKWIASGFTWLVDKYNQTFKGLYICESGYLIEGFKKDYGIPNSVFYNADEIEHRKDIFALKYLMKGNTEWHFRAIANLYGYDVDVYSGKSYFKQHRIPNKIPHKLYGDIENINNIIVIVFYNKEFLPLPHTIPHRLGSGLKISKVKKIFDIMKQSQIKIMYKDPTFTLVTENVTDYMPISIPHTLGSQEKITTVYDEQVNNERIKFCVNQ